MQRLRRLLARRSAREAEGAFVVEGAKLLTEALDSGASVESVYLDPAAASGAAFGTEAGAGGGSLEPLVQRCLDAGLRVYELEPGILVRVADTVTPQPILAVVQTMDRTLASLIEGWGDSSASAAPPGAAGASRSAAPLVVVGVDLRDPGNAGSVLRSAEAAGADAVVLCEGSVDLYNPKTVRASAGTLFHLPVVAGGPPTAVLETLGAAGLQRLGTVARGGADYTTVDLTGPTAVVLGNEANGIPADLDRLLDGGLSIPMTGRAESLNVGIAAAVVCFEAARQRRAADRR